MSSHRTDCHGPSLNFSVKPSISHEKISLFCLNLWDFSIYIERLIIATSEIFAHGTSTYLHATGV